MIVIEMHQGNGYRCGCCRKEVAITEEYDHEDYAVEDVVRHFLESDWDFYVEDIKGAKDNDALMDKINAIFEHTKEVHLIRKNIKDLQQKVRASQKFLDTITTEIESHKKIVVNTTPKIEELTEKLQQLQCRDSK